MDGETTRELTKLAQSLVVMLQSEQRQLAEIKTLTADNNTIAYRNGSQILELSSSMEDLKAEMKAINQTMTAIIEHSITRTVVHDAKDKKIDDLHLTVRYLVEVVTKLTDRMPDLFLVE